MPFRPATLDREFDKFVECPSGETAVRVYVANVTTTVRPSVVPAGNPTIYNVNLLLAGTEYSQVLNNSTKKLLVRIRDGNATLRIAFSSGDTLLNYVTVPRGSNYFDENLDLQGVTIYLQSDISAKVAEILEWT